MDENNYRGRHTMSKHDNQTQPAQGKVQVGDVAPDFTLPAQSGASVSLGDFLGKKYIVLYFYPKSWEDTISSPFTRSCEVEVGKCPTSPTSSVLHQHSQRGQSSQT